MDDEFPVSQQVLRLKIIYHRVNCILIVFLLLTRYQQAAQ